MTAPSKTLLVMAGGTGGHIYPGLAVAHALREQGWKVVWLGNPDGMEARLVPKQGIECVWIRFSALRGKGILRKLLLPFNLLRGFWQARQALKEVKPDVVLGMGGYITFPGGMMAVLSGIPLVLHEQNSVAGLANRVLAKVADRVLSGFPQVLPNAEWVGNPVRREISQLPPPIQRTPHSDGRLRILVIGGSLGAKALNDGVPRAISLLPADKRPVVVHQAGEKQMADLQAAYAAAGVEGDLRPFIHDMAEAYANADLLICRAGALTVAELACAGVPAILVPFPHAVDDHQTGNARFLSEAGAAVLLPQHELTPEKLADLLQSLSPATRLKMAEAARSVAKSDATALTAAVCQELADRKQK